MMRDDVQTPVPGCNPAVLGGLMPLCVWLGADGAVRGAGPTLIKLTGRRAIGRHLNEVFTVSHPRVLAAASDLTRTAPIRLALRGAVPTPFKGVAILLPGADVLMNLSFGYGLREAVRDHSLSDTDFAATDLAVEFLYLAEANAALMAEAKKFSERLRGARSQAIEQALTDPLTGLRNRRSLDRKLAQLGRSATPFGMIHVDLDHFKQINDTLGHAAGDHVLQEVGERLRTTVRDNDCVARIGGDEFVVLLPDMQDRNRVGHVAQRLLDMLAQPIPRLEPEQPDTSPITISASLGVVIWDGNSPAVTDKLLLMADRALYRSKDAGRGRFSFSEAG